MHVCRDGGALVSRAHEVPNEPSRFHLRGLLTPVGCNLLRCGTCEEFVQARVGWIPKPDFTPEQVFGKASWGRRGGPLIKAPDSQGRLYVCRCTAWFELGRTYIAPPDLGPDDARPPWRCDGHPTIELPVTLDGLEFGGPADVALFADDALTGWAPPGAPDDSNPFAGAWLNRLYALTYGTSVADAVARAASGALTATEPLARAAALHFLTRYPLGPGSQRLYTVAVEDLELYRGVTDQTTEVSLELNLLRCLGLQERAHRVRADGDGARPHVIEFLRSRVQEDSGLGVSVFPVLAEFDADWLVEHATTLPLDDDDRLQLLDWLDIYAPELSPPVHEALYG